MNKKIRFLIASGPTQEPLDLVRYISNYSTGTMGKYLTLAAEKKGHKVTWVECPKKAQTALELQTQLLKLLPKNDVLIMAAAVCDVRPLKFSNLKIKKDNLASIPLTKNPDILVSLAKKKKASQLFIGFGIESKDIFKNGFKKLKEKSLDLIILQEVTKNKNPFGEKSIEAFLLSKDGGVKRYSSIKKDKLAKLIIEKSEKLIGDSSR